MTRRRESPARKHPRSSERRIARIDALLDYAETQIRDISHSYESNLRSRDVPLELCVKIKNCCENLRSALDYLAHHLFEITYPSVLPPANLAFPLLWERPEDDAKSGIQRHFRDLRSINRGLWEHVERFQPYKKKNAWLRQFVRVVNDHKHWDLAAQSRHTAPAGQPDALGPVVFYLEADNLWVEYRFRGIKANAFFLLMQAHTNIREFVDDVHWHLA